MNRSRRRDRRMSITCRVTAPAVSAALLAVVLGFGPVMGCTGSGERASAEPAARSNASARNTATRTASPDEVIQEVERRYVIGPMAARELGYQVHWQSHEAGQNLKVFQISGDSVFALDGRNFLTRLDRETGRRIWRVPVAEPIQEIIAVTYIGDTVYLTAGGRLLVLDAATGTQTGVQRLERIANTGPVHAAGHLVYGGRNGQLIWHSHEVAFQWRAYQISPSINVRPLLVRPDPWEAGHIVTVGNDGRVTVHDAGNANMLWSKQLLSNVVAQPAASSVAVYVAGLDQHLWAYDLYSGRSIWRYLTETPLRDSPVLVGDRLYQQIPSQGLVCFEALPQDSPGGNIHWTAQGVRGNVIAQRGNRIFVWYQADRQLTVLDATNGGVVDRKTMQQTKQLVASEVDGGEVFAISDDGRVVRLLARN